MSCYFVPRPSFKWPRLALRSSHNRLRPEAIKQSLGWFGVYLAILTVSVGSVYFIPDSKFVLAASGALDAIVSILYAWFLWDTWVDDGRHDEH